jgi:hypothetical protein
MATPNNRERPDTEPWQKRASLAAGERTEEAKVTRRISAVFTL